jgi:glycosyltransferase involved in cell wall biosynthesis
MSGESRFRISCFATQGTASYDEQRVQDLLEHLSPETLDFDRAGKLKSGLRVARKLIAERPDLVVMEGTGFAGGLAVIAARLLADVPYVVSSGDAVGPYIRLGHPRLAPIAGIYERILCRLCAGYVGWSPYLVGRALSFGAPRGMTAANWSASGEPEQRQARRDELGIPEDAIVFGLVGSLDWTESVGYCYGHELVSAVREVGRTDVRALVVGDGSGLDRLRALAGEDLGYRILLPGRVPREQVPEYLSAIDVASLPQSVDGVGSFRYTTKISEYLSAGLPIVTGQIPLAYDLDDGWIWRLAGDTPWDRRYVADLIDLMETMTPEELEAKRRSLPESPVLFDRERQQRLLAEFVSDLIGRSRRERLP